MMTGEEITRDYRLAKDKKAQVKILAELNCCTKEKIIEILKANGVKQQELPRVRGKNKVKNGTDCDCEKQKNNEILKNIKETCAKCRYYESKFEDYPCNACNVVFNGASCLGVFGEPETKQEYEEAEIQKKPFVNAEFDKRFDEKPGYEQAGMTVKSVQSEVEGRFSGLSEKVAPSCTKQPKILHEQKPQLLLKDSGNRTKFASGAVRDIQSGKGRCDLLPLDICAELLDGDAVLVALHQFRCDGRRVHLYDALRVIMDAFFSDGCDMLLEVAIHFEDGAKKYGERNWEKGIPVERYIDSAVRHYLKQCSGDTDERHDRACAWNLLCAAWEMKHHG